MHFEFGKLLRSVLLGSTIGGTMLLAIVVLEGGPGRKLQPRSEPKDTSTDSNREFKSELDSFAGAVSSAAVLSADLSEEAGQPPEGNDEQSREPRVRAYEEPTPEEVVRAVRSTWPDAPDRAINILVCESRAGRDPNAWNPSHPDGGPMQINKATWAYYFERKYGWTWSQVVHNLEIHLAAAREIYEKTGDFRQWTCSGAL